MATKIKGLTVEIGGDTTKLDKALENVNKKSRSLSGELGNINRLLKLDPGNTELLAQKQQVLAEAVANTREKLDTLKEAERQVQEQFERGEVSAEQVRALQREIVATEQKLDQYENAVRETADQLERLGDGASDAAGDIKKEADAAKNAESINEDLAGATDGVKAGFAALAAAAAGAVAALISTAEASREYRTEMGKLNTAFETNGHSAEAAYDTYAELQSILGETDQAVEAANHLSKLVDNEEDLAKWTEICTGVYAQFGASLPIEGLTEAANETAKTGKVTGSLADALNWAGESEDEFNEALEKCTDEQERQAIITETLNGLYKTAAAGYKNTNREVIAANKATEKWNAGLAKLGKHTEPVVTSVKELGAALLEEAEEPLKAVTKWLTDKFFPALLDAGQWIKTNLPAISAVVAGLTASFVAYKAATLATELATKGWTVATLAQAAAQKALNLAMNASPVGLAATAIAGIVVALGAFITASKATEERVDVLTEAEREFLEATAESAQALRDQRAAIDESEQSILAQMGHTTKLADELMRLADNSGKVKAADETRAQFILNELNEALGTEYTMVDGMIQKYDEMVESIYETIEAKKAQLLLEANQDAYVAAITKRQELLQAQTIAEKAYQSQLDITKQKENEYLTAKQLAHEAATDMTGKYTANQKEQLQIIANDKEQAWKKEQELLEKEKAAYDEAVAAREANADAIISYEEAEMAAAEGNYDKVVDLLVEKEGHYLDYSDEVSKATKEAVDALYDEAIEAGDNARFMREQFEKGVDGYTKEMVEEAEKGYEDAMEKFANAYADAESVGQDIGSGLSGGMESMRKKLIAKAKSLVDKVINAMKDEADSHSPSRKTMALGEDIGEGTEIGLENKTRDVARAAARQVDAILDAYDVPTDPTDVLRNLDAQRTQRQSQQTAAARSSSATMLEKILAAIEAGQLLVLDGDQLVGGTAAKYDKRLGQDAILAARGAK